MDERFRNSAAQGALVKVNVRQCECGQVWVPEIQASKTGIEPGWYESMASAFQAFALDPAFDPVVRASTTKRGRIVCPKCK